MKHKMFICEKHICKQGLQASSLQFTSPLAFNAIFRDCFTLRHELTAGSEIRNHVPAKFKHVMNIVTCTCTMLWLRHVCDGTEISKKLTSNPRLSAKNTPLFLFPQMGHSLQIFVQVMPLHAHVFSFTHNAVVLSGFRCVHPENQTIIFRFLHFMNQNKCRLHKTWDDR